MIDAEGDRKFVQAYDCRVTAASLKAADVLLTETRYFRELLLGQALFLPEPLDVLSDQSAHIHARQVSGLHSMSLSTIVCGVGEGSRGQGWQYERTRRSSNSHC